MAKRPTFTVVEPGTDASSGTADTPAPTVLVPLPQLERQNDTFLAMAARRLREIVVEGQHRRADGRIAIELSMAGGLLTSAIRYRPDWQERLR